MESLLFIVNYITAPSLIPSQNLLLYYRVESYSPPFYTILYALFLYLEKKTTNRKENVMKIYRVVNTTTV